MVTAELAVAMPVVVLLLAAGLAGLQVGIAQVQCVDAARVAARAASRGDPPERVLALARAAAPDGASVSVGRGADVVVVVRATTRGMPLLPALTVSASATAPAETGTSG